MAGHWLPLTHARSVTATGFTVVLTTDVACHLWLFYTFQSPWVHPHYANKRGLQVPWDSYWCYVSWIIVEQDEPGDTTTHTFQITGLVTCNHIWYRFHGEIGGVTSPSDSPIIHAHYVAPPITTISESLCPGNAAQWVDNWNRRGQYFTAAISATPSSLTVWGTRYGTPAASTVGLYTADGVGRAVPPPLASVAIDGMAFPLIPDNGPVTIAFPNVTLLAGGKYVFLITCASGGSATSLRVYTSPQCEAPNVQWHSYWTSTVNYQVDMSRDLYHKLES